MDIEFIVFVEDENTVFHFNTHEEVVLEFGDDWTATWNSDEVVFDVVIISNSTDEDDEIPDYFINEVELPESNSSTQEL